MARPPGCSAERRPNGLLLGAVALLAACEQPAPAPQAYAEIPPLGWVDVRLASMPPPELACTGPWRADGAAGEVRGRGARLPRVVATLREGRVLLGDLDLGAPPVTLGSESTGMFSCGAVRYRGSLRVEADTIGGERRLRIVNRLPVEDYLRGVVPAEMPARFGLEALKAQAVAARSYALAEADRQGWLYSDVRSQAYAGRDGESWMGNRAVYETAGLVLVSGKDLLPTWYHSTCGGLTSPARDVFGYPPPGAFEQAIACRDCRRSPYWSWEREIPGDEVCAALGLPPPLEGIETEPATFPGRPATVSVRAGGATTRLAAVDFRARLSAGRPMSEQLLSTFWHKPARVVDDVLRVAGGGWGHGVGLCQYGAAGYASRGATFRTILRRYYPGLQLVRLR